LICIGKARAVRGAVGISQQQQQQPATSVVILDRAVHSVVCVLFKSLSVFGRKKPAVDGTDSAASRPSVLAALVHAVRAL
jgi:hypothetical protein